MLHKSKHWLLTPDGHIENCPYRPRVPVVQTDIKTEKILIGNDAYTIDSARWFAVRILEACALADLGNFKPEMFDGVEFDSEQE